MSAGKVLFSLPRDVIRYPNLGNQFGLRAAVKKHGRKRRRTLDFSPSTGVLTEVVARPLHGRYVVGKRWRRAQRRVSHYVRVEIGAKAVRFVEIGPVTPHVSHAPFPHAAHAAPAAG